MPSKFKCWARFPSATPINSASVGRMQFSEAPSRLVFSFNSRSLKTHPSGGQELLIIHIWLRWSCCGAERTPSVASSRFSLKAFNAQQAFLGTNGVANNTRPRAMNIDSHPLMPASKREENYSINSPSAIRLFAIAENLLCSEKAGREKPSRWMKITWGSFWRG